MNQAALKRLMITIEACHSETTSIAVDSYLRECLAQLEIFPIDTGNTSTGEQLYHSLDPQRLNRFKSQGLPFDAELRAYWASLPHPNNPNEMTGPRNGLEAAAQYSVGFHWIRHPRFWLVSLPLSIIHVPPLPNLEKVSCCQN